jgi:hypothetical protein
MKFGLFLLFFAVFFSSFAQSNHTHDFVITDFQAVGDGKTVCTAAIQKAIDAAALVGGKVIIPAGTFISATLFLKSNMELELRAGAVLKASPDLTLYPKQTVGHNKDRQPYHFIIAYEAKNLKISGMGTIDGNGYAFWKKERKSEWDFYVENEERISPMFEFRNCENLSLNDIAISNSPGWTVHLQLCEQVRISGIKIENELYGPNTDGLDINACKDVIISDCNIRAGDDAIVLKTTKDANRACENITVSNCILETHCAAMKLGTESHFDFKNILFNNCIVKKATRIIDLTICDGGHVENVRFNHIVGETNAGWPLGRHIVVNLNKRDSTSRMGSIKNLSISDYSCRTDCRILIGAMKGLDMSDIRLENIRVNYPMMEGHLPLARNIEGDRNYGKGLPEMRSASAAMVVENVKNLSVSDFQITWPIYPVPEDWKLLKSPLRFYNREYYEGKEAKIKSGEIRPKFHAFWGKNIQKGKLDMRLTSASEVDVKKVVLVDSDVILVE